MRHRSLYAVAVLALSAAFAPLARAQDPAMEREIAFVRGLARDLGFIEVAQREVDALHEKASSSDDQRAVSLLGIEVAMVGAKGFNDRVKQRALYEDALNRAKDIIDEGDEKTAQRALLIFGDAVYEFGRFLIDELQLARDTDPGRVPELEEAAAQAFREGVEACDKAMAQLAREKEDDEAVKLQHDITWLRKGILLREQARAVKADRDYLATRARDTLEELIFEVGEHTALGLRAMFEYSQVDEVMGDLKSASSYYGDTIDSIDTVVAEQELPPETVSFLLDMAQEVFAAQMRTQFAGGDIEKVLGTGTNFREFLGKHGAEGAELLEVAHIRFGHEALLTEAKAKAESGKTDLVSEAMEMAQAINEKHPNDVIGLLAKSVIEKVIQAQSNLVTGDVLFEIAKGSYQAKDYEAARNGLKRALVAMTDDEANVMGMETWYMIGTSYAIEGRFTESVMAYTIGLEQFGPTGNEWVERTTDRLDQASAQLKRQSKNDPAMAALHSQTEQALIQWAPEGTVSKTAYRDGNRLMASNEFGKAAEAFAKVEQSYLYYDISRARYAYALALAGKREEARKAIDDFLAYLETPAAEIAEDDKQKANKEGLRKQALGELAYRTVSMDYNEATGAVDGVEKDLSRYRDVLEGFKSFVTNHGDVAEDFVPYALNSMGRLHAELGELDKAEQAYRQLQANPGGAALAAKLSTVVLKAWNDEVNNREAELEAAQKANDGADLKSLRTKLTEGHQKLLSLGREYIRNSSEPQYGVMYNTMASAKAIGNWDQVREIAEETIKRWGEHPDYSEKVDSYIRPALGEAAIKKGEFQVAYDMLIAAEKANPKNYETKRLICLALGGWLEIDESANANFIKGLGKPDEAYSKWFGEYKDYADRYEKYSLEWYEFTFQAFYFAKQAAAAKIDDKYDRYAQTLMSQARSIDNWATLEKLGARGSELRRLFNIRFR